MLSTLEPESACITFNLNPCYFLSLRHYAAEAMALRLSNTHLLVKRAIEPEYRAGRVMVEVELS